MKNIHILKTDKPSRLYLGNNGNFVFGMMQTSIQSKNDDFTNQHIYITSYEEIKEGDWCFDLDVKKIVKVDSLKVITSKKSKCWYYKKIILTTDQDLIKDGVQAIDDEFLEWFVKNPSCQEVEVLRCPIEGLYTIIPKEEPKQETLKEFAKQEETLEEGFDRIYKELDYREFDFGSFKIGVEWQQEQDKNKYSEEEVLELLQDFANEDFSTVINIEEWFKQFKKK